VGTGREGDEELRSPAGDCRTHPQNERCTGAGKEPAGLAEERLKIKTTNREFYLSR